MSEVHGLRIKELVDEKADGRKIISSFGFKLGKVCPYLESADMVVGEITGAKSPGDFTQVLSAELRSWQCE